MLHEGTAQALLVKIHAHEVLVWKAARHGDTDLYGPVAQDVVAGVLGEGQRVVVTRLAVHLAIEVDAVLVAAHVLADAGVVELVDHGPSPADKALRVVPGPALEAWCGVMNGRLRRAGR